MTQPFETIRTETTYKGIPLTLHTEFYPEDLPLEDIFDDTIDNIKTLYQQINNGTLTYFYVTITAYFKGHNIASTSLGACLYSSTNEFLEQPDGYYQSMLIDVKEEAYKSLKTLYQDLLILIG